MTDPLLFSLFCRMALLRKALYHGGIVPSRRKSTACDILSKIRPWLPALGALYLGLCNGWGFLYGSEVNETIALIATLLATNQEISTARYYVDRM